MIINVRVWLIFTAFDKDSLLLIYGMPMTLARAVPPMQNPVTAANAKLEYAKFFSSYWFTAASADNDMFYQINN